MAPSILTADQVRMRAGEIPEQRLARDLRLEDQAGVGVVADHHQRPAIGLGEQRLDRGPALRAVRRVAAGVRGDVEQGDGGLPRRQAGEGIGERPRVVAPVDIGGRGQHLRARAHRRRPAGSCPRTAAGRRPPCRRRRRGPPPGRAHGSGPPSPSAEWTGPRRAPTGAATPATAAAPRAAPRWASRGDASSRSRAARPPKAEARSGGRDLVGGVRGGLRGGRSRSPSQRREGAEQGRSRALQHLVDPGGRHLQSSPACRKAISSPSSHCPILAFGDHLL